MELRHVENLLRRYKGQGVNIKTVSGGIYEGAIADVTNDYVALGIKRVEVGGDQVYVLLHSIESVLPLGEE